MTENGFSGIAPCVHCGFCLQSCPTFLITGDEADSPRGRIVLMRALAAGTLPALDQNLQIHLDRCLGCRACEPVCPSGVRYGPALETARALIAEDRPPSFIARLVLAVMAEPLVRKPALVLARMIRPVARWFAGKSRLGFAFGMLGATKQRHSGTEAQRHAAMPRSGHAAALFRGCIMDGLFSHVNDATRRTLQVNGYMVDAPAGQGCCGALHAHAGLRDEAIALARKNVAAFAANPDAPIAVNSAGCGAMMREYGHLLAGDPLEPDARAFSARVRDVTELLAAKGPRPGAALNLRVAYDPPCHLVHAQRVSGPPQAVLEAIPGLIRVEHAEADLCCGSAGIYSLVEPELSRAVLARKTAALLAAEPDVIATGNPGCVMQIGAGLAAAGRPVAVLHPVELLDQSYQSAGLYSS